MHSVLNQQPQSPWIGDISRAVMFMGDDLTCCGGGEVGIKCPVSKSSRFSDGALGLSLDRLCAATHVTVLLFRAAASPSYSMLTPGRPVCLRS